MRNVHKRPQDLSDKFALKLVKFLRWIADAFFKKRYAHRAMVLETVAAVPGMVGAGLLHFRCLRKIRDDQGWIKTLLAEAHNERMHLMTFIKIARPSWLDRVIIFIAQFIFVTAYFLLYIVSAKTAHRFVGYLEEEAVISYTEYLEQIDEDPSQQNVPAPRIAIEYWKLPKDARLREVVIAVRKDEARHRDNNHRAADILEQRKNLLGPKN